MDGTAEFIVSHDLEPASAKAMQSALLEAIGASENKSFSLDISDKNATQVALQILVAGFIELRERGLSYEAGPTAATVLERSALKEKWDQAND